MAFKSHLEIAWRRSDHPVEGKTKVSSEPQSGAISALWLRISHRRGSQVANCFTLTQNWDLDSIKLALGKLNPELDFPPQPTRPTIR